ncbi:hypothetical protein ACU8V1_01030 [Rhizobium leguminosarum]
MSIPPNAVNGITLRLAGEELTTRKPMPLFNPLGSIAGDVVIEWSTATY